MTRIILVVILAALLFVSIYPNGISGQEMADYDDCPDNGMRKPPRFGKRAGQTILHFSRNSPCVRKPEAMRRAAGFSQLGVGQKMSPAAFEVLMRKLREKAKDFPSSGNSGWSEES